MTAGSSRAPKRDIASDALGDGADPAVRRRAEMKDAVGLAQPDRPEHEASVLYARPAMSHGV